MGYRLSHLKSVTIFQERANTDIIILTCRKGMRTTSLGVTSQPKKAWAYYSFTHHVYTRVENHYSLGDTNISCLFNLATEHAFPPHRLQFWKVEWIPLKPEMVTLRWQLKNLILLNWTTNRKWRHVLNFSNFSVSKIELQQYGVVSLLLLAIELLD